MKRSYKAFTLIELLVVIAIIGLLSTLAVVALNSARLRSRDAKRVSDIRQIQTALELGFSETQLYPVVTGTQNDLGSATATGGTQVLCNVSGVPKFQATNAGCSTVYMGLVPRNPTPNGVSYWYDNNPPGSPARYHILFSLEGQTGQLGIGMNCAGPDGITAGSSC
jgi:prepilin-type N-terminal cleavage/methylation domain-containing protein